MGVAVAQVNNPVKVHLGHDAPIRSYRQKVIAHRAGIGAIRIERKGDAVCDAVIFCRALCAEPLELVSSIRMLKRRVPDP